MRPYFAIIKDSFRAAMASRVLYVLLILITLLLAVIAPFHVRETLDWELRGNVSVPSPGRLVLKIVELQQLEKPVDRIWENLPAFVRKRMQAIADRQEGSKEEQEMLGLTANSKDEQTHQLLVGSLNSIIKDPDFYRVEDWKGVALPEEAKGLIELGDGNRSKAQTRRLNRLLIATALSPDINRGHASAIGLYYFRWETPLGPFGMSHEQFAQGLTAWLPWFFDKFVMSIGLLIAILVTASMIPETFQSGSLNLLLSKPISRHGLYVAKFAGGCVFVTLCTSYLFFGVWVWLGLGLGVWDRGILLSIPLYVIVFAIYFSVSAFVGLLWRNSIVAVILTLLFWAFCFAIGSGYGVLDTKMNNSIMVGLVPVGDGVLAVDSLQQINDWDGQNHAWDPKLDAGMGEQRPVVEALAFVKPFREEPMTAGLADYLPPLFDRESSRIFTSRFEIEQSLASGKKKMFVSDVGDLNFKEVGYFPRDTVELFSTTRGIVAATSSGSFYRLNRSELDAALGDLKTRTFSDPKPGMKADETKPSEAKLGGTKPDETKAVGTKEPDATKSKSKSEVPESEKVVRKLFDRIGPDAPVSFRTADLVDYSAVRDEFAAYRLGVVSLFRADGDEYSLHGSLKLDLGFNKSMSCRMAYQGGLIVLAFGNGKVITVDGETLEELQEYQLESRSGIRRVAGSLDGRYFGVLYRNGNLWMLDRESDDHFSMASVQGQGGVCSFAFGGDDDWWVTQDSDRVTNYALSDGSAGVRYAQSGTWIAKTYRYGLRPFYTVCPKPSEFYKLVPYLSSAGNSESNENVDVNLTTEASNPWSPLTSGLAFMLVMLVLGCVVFQFKDY